jgi:WhiB family transcriptional regulator, redox-sensing transcriptional regulator
VGALSLRMVGRRYEVYVVGLDRALREAEREARAHKDPWDIGRRSGLMDWRHRAACLDLDPELFFPIGVTGRAAEQVERAKGVCATCPVSGQCLDWALSTNQDAGVWGGMSEDERRTLQRRRRR